MPERPRQGTPVRKDTGPRFRLQGPHGEPLGAVDDLPSAATLAALLGNGVEVHYLGHHIGTYERGRRELGTSARQVRDGLLQTLRAGKVRVDREVRRYRERVLRAAVA